MGPTRACSYRGGILCSPGIPGRRQPAEIALTSQVGRKSSAAGCQGGVWLSEPLETSSGRGWAPGEVLGCTLAACWVCAAPGDVELRLAVASPRAGDTAFVGLLLWVSVRCWLFAGQHVEARQFCCGIRTKSSSSPAGAGLCLVCERCTRILGTCLKSLEVLSLH